MTLYEKQIRGALYGSSNAPHDIPRLVELYSAGLLKLDELVTREYSLDQINEGYQDMRSGKKHPRARPVLKRTMLHCLCSCPCAAADYTPPDRLGCRASRPPFLSEDGKHQTPCNQSSIKFSRRLR